MTKRRVFITGTAGFIGYHLAQLLLDTGFQIAGFDGMTDYYDVGLKQSRLAGLSQNANFTTTQAMLEDMDSLSVAISLFRPDAIVHLAAQAGVRYSVENPRAYLESNIVGTFNVMECARAANVGHLLMASTSSAYGANTDMPFRETDRVCTPMTFYAASKLANEAMGHSYAHIYNLPVTMFRFFTVYGPWGRPDMAPHKFTKGIVEGAPIDVYNNGEMWRDFTYVEDLVRGIAGLIDAIPERPSSSKAIKPGDSLSPVAPFRVVNIGNSRKVRLMDFINAIEKAVGRAAVCNFMPMQQGDVLATWAEASLLQSLTGYRPQTDLQTGVNNFVQWYQDYYHN
jgi:UDP-glucuronate 4-epimerase